MDSQIRPEFAAKRLATRKVMEAARERLIEHTKTSEFPFWLVDEIKKLGVNGVQIKDFGGPGMTNLEVGAVAYEMAKVDSSVATFYLVHNCIGQNVVDALGDNEQR